MDKSSRLGEYVKSSVVAGENYTSYVPPKLPPQPPIDMEQLYPLLDRANVAVGRLDGMSMILPEPSLFLYMYIRKEAVLSSQIEGTQSTLSDLLIYENERAPRAPINDVYEVSNYVTALTHGLNRLDELPICLRLIKEMHAKLMKSGRGSHQQPGEFRTSQNWIGGSRPGNAKFVPPSPERLTEALGDLEKFLNDELLNMPTLIKAALAHVQFETIHPFLDGNGRLGRLLIILILCSEGILQQPLLYLSLYFKSNRQAYYNHLQLVRDTGDWEAWIRFFLIGVIDTAKQATDTAQNILQLFSQDSLKIGSSAKSYASIINIHHYFQKNPVSHTAKIKEVCKVSLPTVLRSLSALEDIGIIEEITGKERHKIYVYKEYLDILSKGTEPIKY